MRAGQRGFTHVSDHARHALEACRSPRVSAHGWPVTKRPFHSTCAERAGKNVLNTPIGRLLKPGGALSTKGSSQSYQVRRMWSAPEVTVSTAVDRGSPARPNSAVITGMFVSANAGNSNVSIVRWSQRVTATLSLKMRIEKASRYIKLEQLALSPQCGFSTSANEHIGMTEAQEKAKLARIVEVARDVWGG